MFEYQSVPRIDEHRDVQSAIDAGELDEHYLIKHASDYGKCAKPNLFSRLTIVVARLFDAWQSARTKRIDKPAHTVLHSAAQSKLEH